MTQPERCPLSFNVSSESPGVPSESAYIPQQYHNSNEGLTDDDLIDTPTVAVSYHVLMPKNNLLNEIKMDIDSIYDERSCLPEKAPLNGQYVSKDSFYNINSDNCNDISSSQTLSFPSCQVTSSSGLMSSSAALCQNYVSYDDDNDPDDNSPQVSHVHDAKDELWSQGSATEGDIEKVKIHLPLADDRVVKKIINSSLISHSSDNPYLITDSDMQKYMTIIRKVLTTSASRRKRKKDQRKAKRGGATTTVWDADDSDDSTISSMSSCSSSTDDDCGEGDDVDVTRQRNPHRRKTALLRRRIRDEIDEECSNSFTGISNIARPLWDPFGAILSKRSDSPDQNAGIPLMLSWKGNDKRPISHIKGAKRYRCDGFEDAEVQKQTEEELIAAVMKMHTSEQCTDRRYAKGALLNGGLRGGIHQCRTFGGERKVSQQEEDVLISRALEELDIASAGLPRNVSSMISQKGKSILMEQLLGVSAVENEHRVCNGSTNTVRSSPSSAAASTTKTSVCEDGTHKTDNTCIRTLRGSSVPNSSSRTSVCSSRDTFCLTRESLPVLRDHCAGSSPYERRRIEGRDSNVLYHSTRVPMEDIGQLHRAEQIAQSHHQFANIVGLRKKPRFEEDCDLVPGARAKSDEGQVPLLYPLPASSDQSSRLQPQRKRVRGHSV